MCADSHGQIGAALGCPSSGTPYQPFTAVQQAAVAFTDKFSNYDRLGLVSYSDTATADQPLSSSFGPGSAFQNAILGLHPSGSTNIGHALEVARTHVAAIGGVPDAVKVIVLLTDGIPNVYSNGVGGWIGCGTFGCQQAKDYAIQQAGLAADAGILVFTIGLGDSLDGAFLQAVATEGDGIYLHAPQASDLQGAFETIAEQARVRLLR
jgi:Mg-chelatase subunit ChlD